MKRKLTLALTLIGVLITTYLTILHYIGKEAVCPLGSPEACSNVMQSSYAVFMGIPVALLGLLAYVGILYLLWKHKKDTIKASAQVAWLALVGVFAAGYFNWIMYAKLQQVCTWCEASHIIMITLFFVNSPWKMNMKVGIFIGTLLLGGISAGMSNAPVESGLGACLSEKGYIFYGAYWCPHCSTQKDLLGSEYEEVYVECAIQGGGQTEFCKEEGIESYPTWEFPDGTKEVGVISVERLKELSGC